MVTIELTDSDSSVKVVSTFEHDKYPRGGNNVGIDSMTQAAINADFNYDEIYDKDYPEYDTTIGVIELNRRSVMTQRIEDYTMVAQAIGGYVSTWVVCDDPEQHPEIYKQVQALERL